MSLTTQAFTYALNNIEELTKFIQNRGSNIINDVDDDFNEDDIFVIFTMFKKSIFTTHLLPEPVFLDGVYVDPYALNNTILAVTNGKTLTSDYDLVKSWFACELTKGLIDVETLDTSADTVIYKKNTNIIKITEYDRQLPLKSFLRLTGQDTTKVHKRLVKHLNISSDNAPLIEDMAKNYYNKIMDQPLDLFLSNKNHGLEVLNDVTKHVTYM